MLRIQRAILVELLGTLLLSMIVVTSVLFAGLCLQIMGRLQSIEIRFLLALLPPLLPVAIAFGMPYAFLLSVSLVYGRMVSDREVIALRASGVHPRVVVMPALALGAVLSLVAFLSSGWVLPDSAQAVRIQSGNLVDLFLGQLGGPNHSLVTKKCRLSYASYEPSRTPGGVGAFRDLEFDLRTDKGVLSRKLLADEARLRRQGNMLLIDSGHNFVIMEGAGGNVKVQGAPVQVEVGLVDDLGLSAQFSDVLGQETFEAKAKDVNLPDLVYLVERGDTPRVPLRRSSVELHTRLSGALAPFIFGLTAAAISFQLSVRSRRLTGFLLAFLPVLAIYSPLAVAGKSLADGGRVTPFVGMWSPHLVLLLAGLLLLRRAYVR